MPRFTLSLAIAATLLLPGLAIAQGCQAETQSMSCAEGQIWDDTARACVTPAS